MDQVNMDVSVDVVAMQQEEMENKRLEAQKRAEQRSKSHVSTPMHWDKRTSNPNVIQMENMANNMACVGTNITKSHLQKVG